MIWRIFAQTTSQNQAKHVPCDLHSTQPRLARGHQADSLSGKGSPTLADNGCIVFNRKDHFCIGFNFLENRRIQKISPPLCNFTSDCLSLYYPEILLFSTNMFIWIHICTRYLSAGTSYLEIYLASYLSGYATFFKCANDLFRAYCTSCSAVSVSVTWHDSQHICVYSCDDDDDRGIYSL